MSDKYISLDDLCQQLSISKATGRNWLRLGKIESQKKADGQEYFSIGYAESIRNSLSSGDTGALRSRRNKMYVSGNSLYDRYVSDTCISKAGVKKLTGMLADNKVPVTESVMRILLADCALKLVAGSCAQDIEENMWVSEEEFLALYINNKLEVGAWQNLIDDIIRDKDRALCWICDNKELLNVHYEYQRGEDILGLLYMSIRDQGSRKAAGSYYTPTDVARTMIKDVMDKLGEETEDKRILDPCCGTGNFLIQLPEKIDLCNIYACDIDELSVQLARVNLALARCDVGDRKLSCEDVKIICAHVECGDFLKKDSILWPESQENDGISADSYDMHWDVIIGNPPWGYSFDSCFRKYLGQNYRTAVGKGIESCDVFVERALGLLSDGGVLSFVIPESLLNVRCHGAVRQVIAESANIDRVRFLGDVFHGVQCPAVVLNLIKSGKSGHSKGALIEMSDKKFIIGTDRPLGRDQFVLRLCDKEYEILRKLENAGNCVFLRGNADFALGIVTGDNWRYISDTFDNGKEPVISGADVFRYIYDPPVKYIASDLSKYQQAAAEAFYRAPEKLIYRFINRQLVFAYDDTRKLTLNSCNVVIPHISGLDMRYIMAVLNSRVAQYIYEKRYNAVKVLRSHIETIPVPVADELEQRNIISKVKKLIMIGRKTDKVYYLEQCRLYDEIDDAVRLLYTVTDEEYEYIKQTLSGDKYML